ncbi:uncharacterized protein LOC116145880 [Pistacia vera]|uniref:uncharacterized protein LOC116145880 n=1 Tax=Pistacia vera TaxID=55513 RepID=UPI001262B065|nr:uncharacterized protein LOC116145880 [Pistacia vera]
MEAHSSSSNLTSSGVPPNLPVVSVKLLEKNYSFWRSQILPALTSHGLEGFVTGEKECPLMILHVAKCTTSYEIWNVLELHFQSVSKARTLHLRNLLQITKKEGCNVSEYVLKIKELGDELIASGVNITDKELLLYILDGLGPEYDAVVANLTACSSQTTLQEAQFLLHKHEIRLERQQSSLSNFHEHMASALLASKQSQIESSLGSQNVSSASNGNFRAHNFTTPQFQSMPNFSTFRSEFHSPTDA